MSQLVIENAVKDYQVGDQTIRAVDGVSLSVEQGEFISVVGHSGSGKTTLLSMIGGLTRPSSGRISFAGTDLYSLDSDALAAYRADRIGFMFQFASLLPMLTARENLLLPVLFRTMGNNGDGTARALELLTMVGLSDKIDAFPGQLSGGQQRRVAIARALMNDPEIILADEPTGDLDEETEAEIMALFHRLNNEKKVTFILITHNLDLASQAKRRLRMSHGKVSEETN